MEGVVSMSNDAQVDTKSPDIWLCINPYDTDQLGLTSPFITGI